MQINVHSIRVQSGRFINYSYVVFMNNQKTVLLIDPAWEHEKIDIYLSQYRINQAHILLTHSHYDHINLVEYYQRKLKAQVWISDKEEADIPCDLHQINKIHSESRLPISEINIYPIFTPGHTMGSICYFVEQHLFTGDTLFFEGCGMCFGRDSSPEDLYRSFQKLRKLIPPNVKVYPGHCYGRVPGQVFSSIVDNNIYFHFSSQKEFIKFRMRPKQPNWFLFQ